MSDSDEPNNTIIEQLQNITARLERITVTHADRENQTDQRIGTLERRIAELERDRSNRGRATTTTTASVAAAAAAPQQVSPPQVHIYATDCRIQGRSTTLGRLRRRARPVI